MIRRTFMGISLMSILNLGNTKEINRENIFTAESISDDDIKSMFSE